MKRKIVVSGLIGILLYVIVPYANALILSDNFNDGIINPEWYVLQNGCTITESGGQLRIQGTTVQSGWGHGNGLCTDYDFPEGDFHVAVDFSVPEFSGSATRLIYLQAKGATSETVGLFYSYGFGYRVQTWDPSQFSYWLSPFGDEGSAFHRMSLMYSCDSETSGMLIDTRFDNFEVVPEPLTVLLVGLGALALRRKRRR
ncbi:MAG: PEP-CTERM sorting domain-containing protein [Planctomycetes bacterium]|nr:PEP-CTERM sorting domain-containing protein [Planctomycetota bacterium]